MESMNKAKVELVTGFLGAGKTTFIQKYLSRCPQNERTVVIENEFGRAGMDASILEREDVVVRQLTGGCICCGQKVNFHDLLLSLAQKYNKILIEPSGIYTLEDFYDIMESPAVQQACTIDSILMIVDPMQLMKLDTESEKVIFSQLSGAGRIVVSKVDVEKFSPEETINRLQRILDKYGNHHRRVQDYITFENWETIDFEKLMHCGYFRNRINLPKQDHSYLYSNITIAPVLGNLSVLQYFLNKALSGDWGEVVRIKGYLALKDGEIYEINCTPKDRLISKVDTAVDKKINLIGRFIDRRAIKEFLHDL